MHLVAELRSTTVPGGEYRNKLQPLDKILTPGSEKDSPLRSINRILCYICITLSCTRQIESKLYLHSFAKYLHNIMETTKFRMTTYIMEMFSERTYLLTLRNSVTFHLGMA